MAWVSSKLRQLIAWKDKFTGGTKEATRRLASGDRPCRSRMFPIVLAAACLLAGGIAIPLLAGAKAELIYANIVGAISAMCAGAALINNKKPPHN